MRRRDDSGSRIGFVEPVPFPLARSRVPLTIVTGPPGAGKTRYVTQRAGRNDVIIDLDAIADAVRARTAVAPDEQLSAALLVRNRMLADLASDTTHDRAWFIVCAAKPAERATWRAGLGGELVVLATPLDVCLVRIAADQSRGAEAAARAQAARRWWSLNPDLAGADPERPAA